MGTTTLVSALLLLAGANGLQRAQPSATSRRFRCARANAATHRIPPMTSAPLAFIS